MQNNLDYYLSLNYPIKVERIRLEEGGGYCAYIPIISRSGCIGYGETPEEALHNLEDVKKTLIKTRLELGKPVSEPSNEEVVYLEMPNSIYRSMENKLKDFVIQ